MSSVDQQLELAIITGLSGAGRSTAAKSLEDLGWYVVDNLPPSLLPTLVDLGSGSQGAVARVAAVVDVRSHAFTSDFTAAVQSVTERGLSPRIVFLEASDEALIARFDGVRRPHPLQGTGRIVDGIARERELLADVRGDADLVLDTTDLNVHDLRDRVTAAFTGEDDRRGLRATVMSFGYKYGLPVDADLVVDCRFLPNPHWIADLRPLTGLDAPVRNYVLGQPAAKRFLDIYADLLGLLKDGFVAEGKNYLTLAVGCTGGKHRSVAIAERLAGVLQSSGVDVQTVHRDLGRE